MKPKNDPSLSYIGFKSDQHLSENQKWVEEKLRDLERDRQALMQEVDKLKAQIYDKDNCI